MPIPPCAGLLGAFVHFSEGYPIQNWWPGGVLWCLLMASLGFLMISGWRYRSFKGTGVSEGSGTRSCIFGKPDLLGVELFTARPPDDGISVRP